MPPKAHFKQNDTVWALDSGRYYHAKVLAAEKCGQTWSYFVHFTNWNKKWDRWFDSDGLKALDDAEVEGAGASNAPRRHSKGIAADVDPEAAADAQSIKDEELSKKRRRKTLAAQELCEEDAAAYSKLPIPFTLKKLLVDEWEMVTKPPHRLIQLPREYCVRQILKDFVDSKRRRADSTQLSKYQELFEGLCLYFDQALPMILLYRQERSQYDTVLREWPDATPSMIYGVEHLLRLFVKIPRLMSQVALAPTEFNHVHSKFAELLKFLQKNHSIYFVGEYVLEADTINHQIDMAARVATFLERQPEDKTSSSVDDEQRDSAEEKAAEEIPSEQIAEPPAKLTNRRGQKRRSNA